MTLASYASLAGLGPTLTTGEAAAALRISTSAASRLLSDFASHGLARASDTDCGSLGASRLTREASLRKSPDRIPRTSRSRRRSTSIS